MACPGSSVANHATGAGTNAGTFVPWGFNDDWFHGGPQNQAEIGMAGAIAPLPAPSGETMASARFFVPWHRVQPENHYTYQWGEPRGVYDALRAQGIKPVMTLINAPWWANGTLKPVIPGLDDPEKPPLPQHMLSYKNFVREAIEEFPDVSAIEIWNEPNHPGFWTNPNPDAYANLLSWARVGWEEADTDTPLLHGGLTPGASSGGAITSYDFLNRVYQLGGQANFDGISIHPYPGAAPWADTMWNEINRLDDLSDDYNNGDTCMWITEVGISTTPHPNWGSVSPQAQGPVLTEELYASLYGHREGEHEVCLESFLIHAFNFSGQAPWGTMNVVGAYPALAPKPAYCHIGHQIGQVPPSCSP
jgi:hypothetical protein